MRMKSAATILLSLSASVYSQEGQRGARSDATRDLIILKRPPWLYNPGAPGTGCVDPNKFLDTNVVVTFEGDPMGLDASIFMDLEDSFLESYNTLRRDFCDDESRKVTEVVVDESSVNLKGINEFSLRFEVKVGCDLCSSDTTLFEPEPENRRRELTTMDEEIEKETFDEKQEEIITSTESRKLAVYRRPINGIRGVPPVPSPTPRPTPSPTPRIVIDSAPGDGDDDDDDDCCPLNGERRGPYASEFVDALDATLTVAPIQQVLEAIEIASVTCDEPLEDFEAEVFVNLGGNPDNADDSEVAALETSFRNSYNGFNAALCDPLFRTVTQVKAEPDERFLSSNNNDDRKLQRSRFKYRVRGKCRGCGGLNKRLFAQGTSGRRRLEMKYDRQLQFAFDDSTCFCAVGTEERGVFEDEFTVAYDENIQVLRAAGIVQNVENVEAVEEEVDPTWSPTTSPTNFPTAPTDSPVPSPSPSRIPSASPTAS